MRIDPTTKFVRSLGTYYMLKEVAAIVGISETTLRRGIREDEKDLLPSHKAMMGSQVVYLYTEDDIARIESYFERRKTVLAYDGPSGKAGRPPIYTPEQRKQRARLYSQSYYWRQRSKRLTADGRREEALEALQRAEMIRKELRA